MAIGPSRVGRYVLRELLAPTFLALGLYTFVLMMNHFFVVAEKALSKNLAWPITVKLFVFGIPNLLILSIPMAVLLGTLIAVGRLSGDHEWVALQGAGRGPAVLVRPVLFAAVTASAAALLVYNEVYPRANYVIRNLQGEILLASNLASDLRPRVFYDLPNTVLFVDDIVANEPDRLRNVLLVQRKSSRAPVELYLAERGNIYPAADRSGDLIVDVRNGTAHHFDPASPEGAYYIAPRVTRDRIKISAATYLAALLDAPEKSVEDFTTRELLDEYRTARQAHREVAASVAEGSQVRRGTLVVAENRARRATVQLHQRAALPLASFFLALLALPLGVVHVRSGKGAGFAISLVVILVYWVAFTLARNQAIIGKFPAALGPWMGNLVMVPLAWWAYRRLRRPPAPAGGVLSWLRDVRGALAPPFRPRGPAPPRPGDGGDGEEADLALGVAGAPGRFVNRLDQYVVSQYLRTTALALASAYLVYGLIKFKGLMDVLLRNQQPFSLVVSYFQYFPAGILNIVLPVSCLVGAVVAFTVLARRGELTAIKAGGISMRRATLAVIVATALGCLLLHVVDDRIAPPSNRKAQAIEDQIMQRPPRTYGTPPEGRWSFGADGNRLYHYRLYDPARTEFRGLSVLTLDRAVPRILDHRYCEEARWNGRTWLARGGWYRTFGPGDASTLSIHEGAEPIDLDPPAELDRREVGLAGRGNLPEQMTLDELAGQIGLLRKSGYDVTRLSVAYHAKWARAATPLVMVLLGLPFAFRVGRRGSLYGIGVALLLVLVYWAALAIFQALGQEALLDARLAAWGPNVLFALVGSYLLLYVPT